MTSPTIHSPSAAVARTLLAIAGNAACTITHEDGALHVRQGETSHRLACPVRPQLLAKLLEGMGGRELAGNWQFDATARHLIRNAVTHALTEKETLLLAALLAAYPHACTREQLLKDVWSMQADVETHTLETHIYRLRHKLAALEPKPCDIVTVDSAYRLTLGDA